MPYDFDFAAFVLVLLPVAVTAILLLLRARWLGGRRKYHVWQPDLVKIPEPGNDHPLRRGTYLSGLVHRCYGVANDPNVSAMMFVPAQGPAKMADSGRTSAWTLPRRSATPANEPASRVTHCQSERRP
jgi:hypothetical protein